jgi:hypothetical protein
MKRGETLRRYAKDWRCFHSRRIMISTRLSGRERHLWIASKGKAQPMQDITAHEALQIAMAAKESAEGAL